MQNTARGAGSREQYSTASAVFVIQHRKAVALLLAIPFMHLRIQ